MPETQYENAGYVYILINAAFPEFIKIGLTTLDPKERARQLSVGTGIPAPYAVAWKVYVSNCKVVEQLAHGNLAAHRTRNNREFFRLPVEDAIELIAEIAAPYKLTSPLQTPAVTVSEEYEAVSGGPKSRLEAPKPFTELTPASDHTPVSSEGQDVRYLSVESHNAEEMAPRLKPAKLDVLRRLREAILNVAPDCLWRMRNDGKIIFTPLPHKDRSRFRNLMTVHLQEYPVGYRIGKVINRFSEDQLPMIEEMLRALLAERG